MTQSRRTGTQTPITPQRSQQSSLLKSAAVDESTDTRKLVKGNTLNQIFSDEKYIFSVSSTLERLYRYRYDPRTNEVIEIRIYKRVRAGDPDVMNLGNLRHSLRNGTRKPFGGARYDVYALILNNRICGYMLYARTTYGSGRGVSSERMYYAFERKEEKGKVGEY